MRIDLNITCAEKREIPKIHPKLLEMKDKSTGSPLITKMKKGFSQIFLVCDHLNLINLDFISDNHFNAI